MSESAGPHYLLAPLFNFTAPPGELKLGPVSLQPITEEERVELTSAAWNMSSTLGMHLSVSTHCLAGEEFAPETGPFEFDTHAETAVLALRLVRGGAVFTDLIYSKRPSGSHSVRTQLIPLASGSDYTFDSSDAAQIQELFAAIPEASIAKKGLRRALRRFGSSYHRREIADKLLDHWIALEGLFLSGGNLGELKFRAALRVARYLDGDRWNTFKDVRNSYDLRSKVVHGARVELTEVEPVVNGTEDILRKALAKAVLAPKAIDVNALDRAAVEGEIP